jgi:hypothetical protein
LAPLLLMLDPEMQLGERHVDGRIEVTQVAPFDVHFMAANARPDAAEAIKKRNRFIVHSPGLRVSFSAGGANKDR